MSFLVPPPPPFRPRLGPGFCSLYSSKRERSPHASFVFAPRAAVKLLRLEYWTAIGLKSPKTKKTSDFDLSQRDLFGHMLKIFSAGSLRPYAQNFLGRSGCVNAHFLIAHQRAPGPIMERSARGSIVVNALYSSKRERSAAVTKGP